MDLKNTSNWTEQAINMDLKNTSNWTDGSGILLNDSNETFHSHKIRIPTKNMNNLNNAILIVSVLGLPGNLLIIAVFVQKMTTPTRVYIFAHCQYKPEALSRLLYILVFVSIEHLMAVKRPRAFNMKVQRTKKAIVSMSVAAVVYMTVATVAGLNKHRYFARVSDLFVLCVIVLVMTTLMPATMVKRARTSRNYIAVVNLTYSSEPGPSHGFHRGNLIATPEDLVCEHNPEPSNRTDTNRVEPIITRQCDKVVLPENAGSLRVSMVVNETPHAQCGTTAIAGQTT